MKHSDISTGVVLLAFFATLSGCAGSNSSNALNVMGHYTGTFESSDAENDDHGTADLTVASDGTITGSTTDSRQTTPGTITGSSIDRRGNVTLKASYTSEVGIITTTFAGHLTRSGNALTGMLDQQNGDFLIPFTFELQKVEPL